MEYAEITKTVIACSFDVINRLGDGFLESVYEKSLSLALRQEGLRVALQHPIKVMFGGVCAAGGFAVPRGPASA